MRAAGFLSASAALAALAVPLMLPDRPGVAPLGAVPLELPVLIALLAVVPPRGAVSVAMRAAIVGLLAARAVLAGADLATRTVLGRPFDPAFDGKLIVDGRILLAGAIGPVEAAAAIAAGIGVLLLAVWGLWVAARHVAGWCPPRPAATAALIPALALAGADLAGPVLAIDPPGGTDATRTLVRDAEAVIEARGARRALAREAAGDAYADLPGDRLLPALDGIDVIVAFVESYGRTTHDNPLYAPTILGTLAAAEADLRAAGLDQRSAWLTAPTVGGQSWLSHASLLSGLWIDDQARYAALTASDRATLVHLAGRTGRRTAAVMPAITMAWPEGASFGYDAVHAAADLGYRGPPFNWVTMPDQYTWSALERLELAPADRPPVFVEVALISSHAPWTPVPAPVPWEAVGDGTVFAAMARAGDPPAVVWRDRDRVRAQFRAAVDYALDTATAFAARRAEAGHAALTVLVGDHQPAGFVAQEVGGRDVPVHVIGPPALVARLDALGWRPGLRPGPAAPVLRMDAFRDLFLAAFGTIGEGRARVGRLDP